MPKPTTKPLFGGSHEEEEPLVNQTSPLVEDDGIPFGAGDGKDRDPVNAVGAEQAGFAEERVDPNQPGGETASDRTMGLLAEADQLQRDLDRMTNERDEQLRRVEELEAEIESERKTGADLANRLANATKVAASVPASPQNFAREIYLAVLNGMAARGDLSLGKLSGDTATQQICRHAAGIAAFANQAVIAARL